MVDVVFVALFFDIIIIMIIFTVFFFLVLSIHHHHHHHPHHHHHHHHRRHHHHHHHRVRFRRRHYLWRSLRNNDDDGVENITKKMNFRPFKLYRVILESLNSSDVDEFSWSWILKGFIHVQIEKGGRFHVVVVQWTSKKRTTKRDELAEQLFC